MVTTVVAMAGVLGLALLSNSALQAQVGGNAQEAASAEVLAESGLNLAEFYLANPLKAPAPFVNGWKFWAGESNVSFGPPGVVPGTATVAVAQLTPQGDVYDVTSVGKAATGGQINHTVKARVRLNYNPINYALASNASLNLPGNVLVVGNVQVNGTLSLSASAKVVGSALAAAAGGNGGTITIGAKINLWPAGGAQSAPAAAAVTVQDYRTYLYFNGATWGVYAAQNINTVTGNSQIDWWESFGPSPANPAGVFYSNGPVKFNDFAVINGTLLVQSGDLTLNGSDTFVLPKPGFPALVLVSGNLVSAKNNINLTANGVTYLNGSIANTGASNGATLGFYGALVFGGNAASIDPNAGTITVTYDAAKANVPHLNTQASSVSVLSWQE